MNIEASATLDDVAYELAAMARDDLREQLLSDGMPPEAADDRMKTYSFSLLL